MNRYTPPLLWIAACGGPPAEPPTSPDVDPTDGCITVDGEPGWPDLQAAVTGAPDFGTIVVCAGSFTVGVTISRPVTLIGAGPGLTVLAGEGQVPIQVLDAEVTIRDLTITSDRAGLSATDATLTLEDLHVGPVAADGVWTFGTALTSTRLTVEDAGGGGVQLVGGTALLTDTTVRDVGGWGLFVRNDARAEASGLTIQGVSDGFGSPPERDGAALRVEGTSDLEVSDLTVGGARLGIVAIRQSTVVATDAVIWGPETAVLAEMAEVQLSAVEIHDHSGDGIAASDDARVTLTDVVLDAAAGTGLGMRLEDASLVATRVALSGQSDGGIQSTRRFLPDRSSLTLVDTSITDVGGVGISGRDVDLVIQGGSVSGTRLDDDCRLETGVFVCGFAIRLTDASLDARGWTVDTSPWGLVLSRVDTTLTDVELADIPWTSLLLQDGTLAASSLSIRGGGSVGVELIDASATLAGLSVQDAAASSSYSLDTDGSTEETRVHGQAADLVVRGGTVELTLGSFTGGDRAIVVDGGELNVSDTSFDRYLGPAIHQRHAATTTLQGITLSNIGAPAVTCDAGELQATDSTVDDTVRRQRRTQVLLDGEVVSDTLSESEAPAVQATACALSWTGGAIRGAVNGGIGLVDAPAIISGLEMSGIGTSTWAALDLRTTGAASLDLDDVRVSDTTTGPAVRLVGVGGADDVRLSGLTLGPELGADGLHVQGITAAALSSLAVDGAAGDGVVVTGGSVVLTDAAIAGTARHGALVQDGTLAAFDTTITAPGGDGVHAVRATLSATGVSIVAPGAAGVDATGGSFDLAGLSVDGAGTWGLVCDPDVTALTCPPSAHGTLGTVHGCSCP